MLSRLAVSLLLIASSSYLPAAETGRPAYETETWEKTRLLVWAKPEGAFQGDANQPSLWLEDGKPAVRGPDRDTDVLFPASEHKYSVFFAEGLSEYRHLTVEENADVFIFWGKRAYGNIWAKKGSWLVASTGTLNLTGNKNTFLRIDGKELKPLGTRGGYSDQEKIMHDLVVTKEGSASAEMRGKVAVADEFNVMSGKFILGPDSELRCNVKGPIATFRIGPAAILELQSGAVLSKHRSQKESAPDLLVEGVLQAGSEERPLTKDTYLLLSTHIKEPRTAALLLLGKGRVYSSDPTKARLVISSIETPNRPGGHPGGNPHMPGRWKDPRYLEGVKPMIELELSGDVIWNGVVFDHVQKGGLRLADLSQVKQWDNISFGPHNGGAPAELYAAQTLTQEQKQRLLEHSPEATMKWREEELRESARDKPVAPPEAK